MQITIIIPFPRASHVLVVTLAQLHQCLSLIVIQPAHCVLVIQKFADQCDLPLL